MEIFLFFQSLFSIFNQELFSNKAQLAIGFCLLAGYGFYFFKKKKNREYQAQNWFVIIYWRHKFSITVWFLCIVSAFLNVVKLALPYLSPNIIQSLSPKRELKENEEESRNIKFKFYALIMVIAWLLHSSIASHRKKPKCFLLFHSAYLLFCLCSDWIQESLYRNEDYFLLLAEGIICLLVFSYCLLFALLSCPLVITLQKIL